MLVAPISEAVTKGFWYCKRQIPEHGVPNLASLGLSILLLLALLPGWPAPAGAQQAAPQFDDLAARAAAARESSNLPQAIELYRQGTQLKADWAEGWFYLGLLQYISDSFPPAIDAFNHLLAIQPSAPSAMALRGLCEFETGAYDEALLDLDEAVKKGDANEPDNEQIIRFHYAQLLAHARRYQDALLQYRSLASKHTDDPDVLLGMGLAGMRNSTLPKDLPAESQDLFRAAGSAAYAFFSDDSQTADTLFNRLFAQYPTTPNLHFFYGSLLAMRGTELAIPQFQSEVAIAPSNVTAHALLAYWLMFAGRFAEARSEAELTLAAAPDMEIVRITLGRSLAETGDYQRAAELLNQALKNDPGNLEAHLGMAVVYARTGRREDAYRERMVCLGLEK